jgi:hypothetical protein
VPDELTKALLLEEAASPEAIANALFASVTGGVSLIHALIEVRAVSPDVLARYLARSEAPYLRQVVPLVELVERLPPGLCARLLAVPVRRDAITGTVDVVVADAIDTHAEQEIAFHLDAPVRIVRASAAAIDEALRKLRSRSRPPPSSRRSPSRPSAERRRSSLPPAVRDARDDERLYDSRPRAADAQNASASFRGKTLPPPAPSLERRAQPNVFDAFSSEALRPSRVPGADRQAHVVPSPPAGMRRPMATPPWGTPVHSTQAQPAPSDHPHSGLGSEIPIPLTRRTFSAVSGGTQRPPPLVDPNSALGEGIPLDPAQLRQIVEVNERMSPLELPAMGGVARPLAMPSFIPGPPPLPRAGSLPTAPAQAPQMPFADIGGILAALRAAGSRDEVLELVLTGARMVALKVALFVVKRGGYLGWACTPEFGDRAALQAILIPLEFDSVFDEAVREGLYLGPVRHDEVHGAMLHVMRGASRDVAVVPVRVTGKTAVVVVADDLGDTMLATRRLEELARGAGDAFARIVRMRR